MYNSRHAVSKVSVHHTSPCRSFLSTSDDEVHAQSDRRVRADLLIQADGRYFAFVNVIMHVCSLIFVSILSGGWDLGRAYRNLWNSFIIEQLKPRGDRRGLVVETWSERRTVLPVYSGYQCCHLGHGQAAICVSLILRHGSRDEVAYCRPIHILPPLEKAQNHLFITATCSAGPSHRSGLNFSGSGKTSALR